MKIHAPLIAAFLLFSAALSRADAPPNLVPDASFETPAGAWFPTIADANQGSYFVAKEKVAGAAQGDFVLAIQGWDKVGSRVLSGPLTLSEGEYSAFWKVRSFGGKADAGAKVELALIDEKGQTQLLSLGEFVLDDKGEWKQITATAKLAAPVEKARLAFVVSGPQQGARVEVDVLGLFAGSTPAPVNDNADFAWFEAEAMDGGAAWTVGDHVVGWYSDLPSGDHVLVGAAAVAEADNAPAVKTLKVRNAGAHRLWLRFLHLAQPLAGGFTLALKQNGKVVAEQIINEGDEKWGAPYNWVWTSIQADLQPGEVEVAVSRPAAGSSWIGRRLDLLVFTDLLDYQPQTGDFRPKGFLRFTNTSAEPEPYNLWVFLVRHQMPDFYETAGILSTPVGADATATLFPTKKTNGSRPGKARPGSMSAGFCGPAAGATTCRSSPRAPRTSRVWSKKALKGLSKSLPATNIACCEKSKSIRTRRAS